LHIELLGLKPITCRSPAWTFFPLPNFLLEQTIDMKLYKDGLWQYKLDGTTKLAKWQLFLNDDF